MQSPQNVQLRGTSMDGTRPDWNDENGYPTGSQGVGLLEHNKTQTINRQEKMRYIIPEGLSCEKCTLQWWWVSGNKCHYDAGEKDMLKNLKAQGWNANPWNYLGEYGDVCGKGKYGEEFWNCADIV